MLCSNAAGTPVCLEALIQNDSDGWNREAANKGGALVIQPLCAHPTFGASNRDWIKSWTVRLPVFHALPYKRSAKLCRWYINSVCHECPVIMYGTDTVTLSPGLSTAGSPRLAGSANCIVFVRIADHSLTGTEPVFVAHSNASGSSSVTDPDGHEAGCVTSGVFVYPMKMSLTSIRPPGARRRHTTTPPTTHASVIPSNHRLRLLIPHDGPAPRAVNAEPSGPNRRK